MKHITYSGLFLAIIIVVSGCGPIDPNRQVDEGSVENDVYTSEEIGWTIKIPSGWEIISMKQHEEFEKKGMDVMEGAIDEEIDASGLRNLIGFQKDQFNIFQSTSEPFEIENESEWEENSAALKQIIYLAYQDQGILVDSTPTTIARVAGRDFETYEFSIYSQEGELILNQLLFSRHINGYDFGVNINYNNESDKQEMLDAWMNSKFGK
ncbi:MAG: hypothetical protein AB8F95_17305 [Bacteroidia bacterium]